MEITVLFFGELAEVAGANKMAVQNMSDTQSLTEWMVEKYPALKNRTYRLAVNKEVISEKRNLNNGDEVALLPPYAGG
ncbi:MAG TPA: MoaD/ThiS family protein [Bacteroidia bacterium]|jgi:molybdopterin synthase sulfur carrier subunit|nr:MoaD/ThiS family protein [Bacteroidia bacterium]